MGINWVEPIKDELEADFEEEVAALEKEVYLQELIESSLSIARSGQSTNEKLGNDYFEVEIDEREYLHKDDIIKVSVFYYGTYFRPYI